MTAPKHNSDVIMDATSLTIVYSTVYTGADQRKHHSSASLVLLRGIHRWPVTSPYKGSVTRKMFPFGDVIMNNTDSGKIHCCYEWYSLWLPQCQSPAEYAIDSIFMINIQCVLFYCSCWAFVFVRRAGLLWSQQDFEWLWSVPLSSASLY